MSRVAIVTDSTADLPQALVASRSITVVPLTVSMEGRSYLDGVDISPDQFYRRLVETSAVPTTSQPSPGRFVETYKRLLAEHQQVISVHISAKLSGTFASAQQAVEMLEAGDRIRLMDSNVVSMPLGLLVLAAARLADEGGGADAVLKGLEEVRKHTQVYFAVATLENLRRGGRIGRANALLGSILQVKPVLTIQDGEVTPLERVRTWERALSRVVELARSVDRGKGICAIVGNAADDAAAGRIAAELEPVAETLLVQPLGAVVGAHAGPGTVGVGCYPSELLPLGLKRTAGAAANA